MRTNPIKQEFIAKSSCITCGKCITACSKGALDFSVKLKSETGIPIPKKMHPVNNNIKPKNHINLNQKRNHNSTQTINIPKIIKIGEKYENYSNQPRNIGSDDKSQTFKQKVRTN